MSDGSKAYPLKHILTNHNHSSLPYLFTLQTKHLQPLIPCLLLSLFSQNSNQLKRVACHGWPNVIVQSTDLCASIARASLLASRCRRAIRPTASTRRPSPSVLTPALRSDTAALSLPIVRVAAFLLPGFLFSALPSLPIASAPPGLRSRLDRLQTRGGRSR